jgi:diaminopimelate decarboxylase
MSLIFDSCDLVALAKEYGTPLYVVSESMIRQRLKEIHQGFMERYPNTLGLFASKALQTLDICRIVASEGLGLDVVSGGELYTAWKADFPMEKVYFHGNNKSQEELELALQLGVGRIVVDNQDEYELLTRLSTKQSKTPGILFRITPGVDSHTHQYISTGQIDSKFGIPLEQQRLHHLVSQAMSSPHLELLGFHFHVGSQLHTNESHLKALKVLMDLVKDLKSDLGFVTQELNLGGGYGVRYTQEDTPQPLGHFTDSLMAQVYDHCQAMDLVVPRIIIEPGRWIVAEAGVTLYTIGSVKEIPGVRTYVAVDGGMTDNPRPALYSAKYHAQIANRPDNPAETLVTIAGKCCESGDILIWDLPLQKPRVGDILAVDATGAYNYSMASNYNRIPRPAMVLVNQGAHRLSVRRETYQDLLAREV